MDRAIALGAQGDPATGRSALRDHDLPEMAAALDMPVGRLGKPTTSRVASEATCVQRKDVAPLCAFELPFASVSPVALPEAVAPGHL
jgi:hypothetical protein